MPDNQACFIDTNIWLYAFIEAGDAAKSAVARAIIRQSEPVVSAQIVNEVCVNLLKTNAVSEEQISQLIESFYQKYRIVELSKAALLSASRLRQRYSLSFWDSIVVACALEAGVSVLYSEDMQHGLVFEQQLQVVNPFVHP
jgi:predicted nucleic acid-binding protein